MGSPVSPLVANLYLEDLKARVVSSYTHPSRFWDCYVDGELNDWVHRVDVVSKWVFMVLIDDHKRTTEREKDDKLPMLHVVVTCSMGSLPSVSFFITNLSFLVCRKAIHTDTICS